MTTEPQKIHTPTSGRGVLIGLAALFFVPLVGAFWLYYSGGWRPAGSTNHGELISPAKPLAESNFLKADGSPAQAELLRGKWTLLYIGDGSCDTPCRETLWTMQIGRAHV